MHSFIRSFIHSFIHSFVNFIEVIAWQAVVMKHSLIVCQPLWERAFFSFVSFVPVPATVRVGALFDVVFSLSFSSFPASSSHTESGRCSSTLFPFPCLLHPLSPLFLWEVSPLSHPFLSLRSLIFLSFWCVRAWARFHVFWGGFPHLCFSASVSGTVPEAKTEA